MVEDHLYHITVDAHVLQAICSKFAQAVRGEFNAYFMAQLAAPIVDSSSRDKAITTKAKDIGRFREEFLLFEYLRLKGNR